MLLWGIGAGLKARFAPVLTNKDATGCIWVSEILALGSSMNRGKNPVAQGHTLLLS
jgi:hypothetical protein